MQLYLIEFLEILVERPFVALLFLSLVAVFIALFRAVASSREPRWKRAVVLVGAPLLIGFSLFSVAFVALFIDFPGAEFFALIPAHYLTPAAYVVAAVLFLAKALAGSVLARFSTR